MDEEKTYILARVSKDCRAKTDAFIAKYFEKPYGALSWLVEESLLYYIEPRENPNTQLHKKPSRHIKSCLEIIADLRDRGFSLQFPVPELDKSIENVRGSDYRTKNKWRRILEKHGYVKMVRHRILEFGPNSTIPDFGQSPAGLALAKPEEG